MTVPTYDAFLEPILRFLAAHPGGAPARDAQEAAATSLGLTPEQRAEVAAGGGRAVYEARAGWAHDRLQRLALSASPRRGVWRLTQAGVDLVASHPAPLTPVQVQRLASALALA